MYDLIIRKARLPEDMAQFYDIGIINGIIETVEVHPISQQIPYEINMDGRLISQGLINAHHHLDKVYTYKTEASKDMSIQDIILQVKNWKKEAKPEEVYEKALQAAKMSVASGVTALRTSVDVDNTWGLTGFEGVLALKKVCQDYLDIQIVAFAQEGVLQYPKVQEMLKEALKNGADAIGGHTGSDSNPIKHMQIIFEIAREYSAPIEFHVDEEVDPAKMQLLNLIEMVKSTEQMTQINLIHCLSLANVNSLSMQKIGEMLKEYTINITVCPTIVTFGLPIAPAKKLLKMGIPVACGSDNLRDPFNPLGEISPIKIAGLLALLDKFYSDEDLKLLFNCITIGGAEILGVSEIYGIKEGCVADLVLFNGETPEEIIREQRTPICVLKAGRVVWSKGLLDYPKF